MSILNKKRFSQAVQKEQKAIAIRADGGHGIGLGHVMRCLALGLELKALGHQVFFISVRGIQVEQLITGYGLRVIAISEPQSLSEEIELISQVIKDNDCNIVITDSYKLNQDYLIKLKEKTGLLISIDDLNNWAWPADVVINGNLNAKDLNYRSLDEGTSFFLGGQYTLLRSEFYNVPARKTRQKIKQVLVTVGGSDVLQLTPKILRALQEVPGEFEVVTVIGPGFDNYAEIKSIAAESTGKEVVIKTEVKNMSELMQNCDLAISSGGSTLYELAVTGTPAVVLLQADNQVLVAEKMAREGTIVNLGMGDRVFPDDVSAAVSKLMLPEVRADMAAKGQQLIDGLGAKRCAQVIARKGEFI